MQFAGVALATICERENALDNVVSCEIGATRSCLSQNIVQDANERFQLIRAVTAVHAKTSKARFARRIIPESVFRALFHDRLRHTKREWITAVPLPAITMISFGPAGPPPSPPRNTCGGNRRPMAAMGGEIVHALKTKAPNACQHGVGLNFCG
ncbi:hypothetical protein [Hyphomicrobium sp. DY-1]|jgi:hypothetical protein|uniref:hypothetical protein n=1 Tax=Hyphomicrobium sp. DY-1 TaxID=3075650 RepID=UPI0039C1057E